MLSLPTVGVKEFRQNMKKIARATRRGKTFVVTSHKEPLFKVGPVSEDEKNYTLKDFEKISFRSNDPNLSKKIDEIVYGL